jgi:hypothetical protein
VAKIVEVGEPPEPPPVADPTPPAPLPGLDPIPPPPATGPILPLADTKGLWGATLKLLKLDPNRLPFQPKASGGHIPGVGQAVTYSVVKTVVVPADPSTCEAEHALPMPEATGGDSYVPPVVTTVGVKKQVKHKEPEPVLTLFDTKLPLGGIPVVINVLTTVTVALAG